MTLELGIFAVMEYLWDTLEKTPDGKIRYTAGDIEMLWKMGFVDTEHYSLKKWQRVFDPFRQADDTFILDKDSFIALDKYRYKGEIHIPFDSMRINEGLYTDEGLNDLINASIAPSCSLPPDELKTFFDELKNLFRKPEGLIEIRRDAKLKIKDLIDRNPSPLRNLEILFDQMIAQGEDKLLEEQIEGAEVERVTARAAIEASSFSATPTSRAETAAVGLKGIEKAKKKPSSAKAEEEGVSLKKVRRSRKGMRG